MRRLLIDATALLVAAGVAALPAQAGPAKPKPIKGSYTVQLPPDPGADVFFLGDVTDPVDGYCGPNSASQNFRKLQIPARGSLRVTLKSTNPLPQQPPYGMDWDLYVLDADGEEISSSTSPTAQEQTFDRLKKKQTVSVLVCNLNGNPDATVSYVFTYA